MEKEKPTHPECEVSLRNRERRVHWKQNVSFIPTEQEIDWNSKENVIELNKCGLLIKSSYNSFKDANENYAYKLNDWSENELYRNVMNLVLNYNCTGNVSQEILLQYVQDIFCKDDQTHKCTLADLRSNPIQYNFSITNIKALDLSYKRLKNSSLCCVIYLDSCPNRYIIQKIAEIDDPVWNELCDFSLNNIEDSLCIEVQNAKLKGNDLNLFQKEFNYFRRKDTFLIGKCKIPIKNIVHLTGNNNFNYYTLVNEKNESCGKICVKFSVGSNRESLLYNHLHLFQTILLFSIKRQSVKCWMDRWTNVGTILLQMHSTKHKVSINKEYLLKWIVYCQVLKQEPISYTVFYELLNTLVNEHNNNASFTLNEIKLFWDSAKILLHSCFYFIKHFRQLYSNDEASLVAKIILEHNVKTLSLLASLEKPYNVDLFLPDTKKLFRNGTDEENLDIHRAVQLIVIKAGELLFYSTEDDNVNNLCKNIFDTQAISEMFEKELQINYTKILYFACARLISTFSQKFITFYVDKLTFVGIKEQDDDVSEKFWLLYFSVKKFTKIGYYSWNEDVLYSEISHFHDWFKKGFSSYFKHSFDTFIQEIDYIIETDNYKVAKEKHYTKSVVDMLTKCLFIKNKWNELNWPCDDFAFTMMMEINLHLLNSYSIYCDKVLNSISFKLKFRNENKCFDGAVNNISYIIKSINETNNEWLFRKKDLQNIMGEELNETQSKSFEDQLVSLVERTTDDLQFKLQTSLNKLASLMEPTIKRFLDNYDKNVDNFELLLSDLNSYLNINFEVLKSQFCEENYNVLRNEILQIILDKVYELIAKDTILENFYFAKLYTFLKTFIKGIKIDLSIVMEQELKSIVNTLYLKSLDTCHLIEDYMWDSYNKREQSNAPHGTLTVDAVFVENNLSLQITSASDITTLVSFDKYKPYIKVDFVPQRFCKVESENCVRRTKDMTFFEKAVVPIPKDLVLLPNAMVHFEIWHKQIRKDKFLCDAFLPFENIQKLSINDNIKEQTHDLKLGQPQYNDIYNELKLRKKDKVALEFVSSLNGKLHLLNGTDNLEK